MDLAAGKDLKEALRESQDTLRQVQKLEAHGKLSIGIAHDFNNLMNGIVTSLELVRRLIAAGRTAETERFIASAMLSAQRASALNDRLLRFSRRQPADPKPLAINELIAGMVELLRHALPKTIKIDVNPAPDLWPAHGDANQVELAVVNLIDNARDAMPDGGTIVIQTANAEEIGAGTTPAPVMPPGQYVCVRITDSGTGMTEAVMRQAFDPFFTTKADGLGTGLGLTLAQRMARQNGGTAIIESQPGRGTSVLLYLPRHIAADPGI